MVAERFIETSKGTFYGEYIYDQVVPKEHFLRKLNHTGFAGINGWIGANIPSK